MLASIGPGGVPDCELVFPGRFGFIHGVVGHFDQAVGLLPALLHGPFAVRVAGTKFADPDAGADRVDFDVANPVRKGQAAIQFPGGGLRPFPLDLGQDHEKLVAAHPPDNVAFSEVFVESL